MDITDPEEVFFHECPFCPDAEFYGYRLLFPGFTPEDIVVWKTDHFLVLPDFAPLQEGHLLIIPMDHFPCIGALTPDMQEEYYSLRAYVADRLQTVYGSTVFFEHGPARRKAAGCCIDHAHLHCLPCDENLSQTVAKRLTVEPLASPRELQNLYNQGVSYLFMEDPNRQAFVSRLEHEHEVLPSQFLRAVVAEAIGLRVWNWRYMTADARLRDVSRHRMLSTVRRLRSHT